MSNQRRQRLLSALIPALLVLAIYVLFFNRHGSVKQYQSSLAATRASATPPSELARQQSELETQQQQLTQLQEAKRELDGRWQALQAKHDPSPVGRMNAVQQLSDFLWEQRLSIVEESAEKDEAQDVLPPALDQVVDRLLKDSKTKPRIWKVRVIARYFDVVMALRLLQLDNAIPAVPISVTMSETALADGAQDWTIEFWTFRETSGGKPSAPRRQNLPPLWMAEHERSQAASPPLKRAAATSPAEE